MVSRKDMIASIKLKIDTGEWAPGARLPTTSQLMRMYDVSQSTVANAMSTLIEMGLVVGVAGGARYVAESADAEGGVG